MSSQTHRLLIGAIVSILLGHNDGRLHEAKISSSVLGIFFFLLDF